MSQPDPRLNQWQLRFDASLKAAQSSQRPGESPQQFQQRRAAANEALRQLQMSKPTGPTPQGRGSFGQPVAPKTNQKQQPAPKGGMGSVLGAALSPIINAMRGEQ
ncbi:hypothetical protein SAMN06296065_102456 [Novosphingobium panipatense]|uniref:Uncharacterized protein n=2 Tax=Novosphingobium panipatense TaxID=428991 RepID=A0ABY1Q5D0_9SPHN|nr:hypothetical protein SAMN06296065_102456 [Novosphingobium panipatense]